MATKGTTAASRKATARRAANTRHANEVKALEDKLKRSRASARARRNPPGGDVMPAALGGLGAAGGTVALATVLPAGVLADWGAYVAPAILGWWLRRKGKHRDLGTAMLGGAVALTGLRVAKAFVPAVAANPPRRYQRRRRAALKNPAPYLMSSDSSGTTEGGTMTLAQKRAAGLTLW